MHYIDYLQNNRIPLKKLQKTKKKNTHTQKHTKKPARSCTLKIANQFSPTRTIPHLAQTITHGTHTI